MFDMSVFAMGALDVYFPYLPFLFVLALMWNCVPFGNMELWHHGLTDVCLNFHFPMYILFCVQMFFFLSFLFIFSCDIIKTLTLGHTHTHAIIK